MWQFSNRFRFFFSEMVVIADTLLSCWVVLFANSQSFNTSLGMTFLIVGSRRNAKVLGVWKFFRSFPLKLFEHDSVIVHNVFASFTLSLSASQHTWSRKDVGPPKSTSLLSTFHIGSLLCFFPANLMSSTCTDKTFSQPCCNRIFSNCLSHNSPVKGWPYSSLTTGSSTLDDDLGILCRGRRIQMSGHSVFVFSTILEHLPFFIWMQSRCCINCLSCAPWQSGCDIHDFCCCHVWCWWSLFREHCIRARIVFYKSTSEYNSTFVFLVLCLQFGILQMTDVHQWGKMNSCPSSLLHRSPLIHLWFLSGPTSESFQISPITCPLLLLLREFLCMAWDTGINLRTKLWCSNELSPFPAIWSSWWLGNEFSTCAIL